MCLWNGFENCPDATQHCLPHLTHPIQLVHSLVETLRPEVGQKRWWELWENKMHVRSSSLSAAAFKAIAGKLANNQLLWYLLIIIIIIINY